MDTTHTASVGSLAFSAFAFSLKEPYTCENKLLLFLAGSGFFSCPGRFLSEGPAGGPELDWVTGTSFFGGWLETTYGEAGQT